MHPASSIILCFFCSPRPFLGSLGRLTNPSRDDIIASGPPICNDPPLGDVASSHCSGQTYHQESGDDVRATRNEEGEKIHRDSDLRVTTMQGHIMSPQCKTEDDVAHAHQRIKELEDEPDTFYRVCFFMISYYILSSVLHRGQRNKAPRYWLFRRS